MQQDNIFHRKCSVAKGNMGSGTNPLLPAVQKRQLNNIDMRIKIRLLMV